MKFYQDTEFRLAHISFACRTCANQLMIRKHKGSIGGLHYSEIGIPIFRQKVLVKS